MRSKVLLDTVKGRKRKLSCYKSRNARNRRIEKIEICEEEIPSSSSSSSDSSEEEVNINLIPTRVEQASDSDVLVEIKHGDSSLSEKYYETLSQILSDSEIEESEKENMEESENTDVSEESFRDKCLKELRSDELLLNIIEKLEKSNKLNDFMKLMMSRNMKQKHGMN